MNRLEMVNEFEQRNIRDLGLWAEDPRSLAAVYAKTERVIDTLAHLDKPLTREEQKSAMKPGVEYSLK